METGFHKKIVPYLDGSLSAEERAEFEAHVRTNPDFGTQVKNKQDELELLKGLIPAAQISKERHESLESEIRQSAFHLLKEEPKGFWDGIKLSFEDWLSR